MPEIEELRAKAMASMASMPSSSANPNPKPKPPHSKEDGEISSSSEGDLLACAVASSTNTTPIEHSLTDLRSKLCENSKRENAAAAAAANRSSKFATAQDRVPAKQNYHKQLKQLPFKSRSHTWHAPSGSNDNLVISFSDDDTESEPEDSKPEDKNPRRDRTSVAGRLSKPIKTSGPQAEPSERTSDNKTKATQNRVSASRSSVPSIKKMQGVTTTGSTGASIRNGLPLQKQDTAMKTSSGQNQEYIGHALVNNKVECLRQETKKLNELDRQTNHSKRRISGINGDGLSNMHLETEATKFDRQVVKRLKLDENSHSKLTADGELNFPSSSTKPTSEIKRQTFEKIGFHQANGPKSQQCLGQIDSRSDLWHREAKKTVPVSSGVRSGVKNTESMLPYTEAAAPAIQNVSSMPSMKGNHCTSDAGIFLRHEPLDKRIMQVSSAAACVEDGATCRSKNSSPQKLESLLSLLNHPNMSNHSGPGCLDLEALMNLEELNDKELEEALELRRRCELEEMRALKAYRKAQRALIDANDRCCVLYRRRELFSTQLRDFTVESSSSLWPSSWMNNAETALESIENVPKANVDLFTSLGCQVMSKGQNVDVMGFESNIGYRDAALVNASCEHMDQYALSSEQCSEHDVNTSEPKYVSAVHRGYNTAERPDVSAEEDEQNYLVGSGIVQSRPIHEEGNLAEKMVSVDVESERVSSCGNMQDYELEATLRSKLVARLGGKAQSETDSQNILVDYHKDKVDTNSIDKMEAPEELCRPTQVFAYSAPPSVLGIVSRHLKFILPESSVTRERAAGPSCYHYLAGAAKDSIIDDKMMPSEIMNTDSHLIGSAIDPFWPVCMFDLRGKCNDEECLWQHLKDHTRTNLKYISYTAPSSSACQFGTFGTSSDALKSSYGPHHNVMPIPTYWVGSNLIKDEMQSYGSFFARSNWQYWQMCFCTSFPFPFSVERIPPPNALMFKDCGAHADDGNNEKNLSLCFHSEDDLTNRKFRGFADPEHSLELAIDHFKMEGNKTARRNKALEVLSRALEANPNSVVLWVVYLHIFYRKEKALGKDDMFHHAVEHNEGSYELWLLYINSRIQLDSRINAYCNALSVLCEKACTYNMGSKYLSTCILDIFLQMIDFLCMSGNVENAVSRIYGLLDPSVYSESVDHTLLLNIPLCLTIPDKCVFWICCIYLILYKKLPEVVVQQLEFVKDLPFGINWPFILLTTSEKHRASELMKVALDTVNLNEGVSFGKDASQGTILRSALFLAVSHVKFILAIEGLNDAADLLDKYISKHPTCVELVTLSVHCQKLSENESGFERFEQALHNWPKQIPGVQRLWNQYLEYVLGCKCFDLAKELMLRWFCCFCRVQDQQSTDNEGNGLYSSSELPSLALENDGCHCGPEDVMFGLLNLFLYAVLQKDMVKAHVAIHEALKQAAPDHFKHCVREHASFLFSSGLVSLEDIPSGGPLSLLYSYLGDARYSPVLQPLSRRFFQNIMKPRVRKLLTEFLGPASLDCSLVNSVLEECYGPQLLPEKFDEPKGLVDFVESLMQISPANYKLAISVHKLIGRFCKSSGTSFAAIIFWASSLLVNCILQAFPVAPELVWVEAASLLSTVSVHGISEGFHQQALLAYPFSFKLWQSYYSLSNIIGNTDVILVSARERGIELG